MFNVLSRSISVSYSHKINDKYEFRINPKISIAGPDAYDMRILFMDDPFWYYNSFRLQLGVSRIYSQILYLEPILFFKYGDFYSREIQTLDDNGDANDKYEFLNRKCYTLGFGLQPGIKYDWRYVRLNFYFGLGYHVKYFSDEILERKIWNTVVPDNYPINSNYWTNNITLFLGIRLGFRF